MPPPVIDEAIVRRAQRGDEAAFALIVGTYQTPIFNYVLRTVCDRGLAEDLTQEVFIRVHQNLPRFSFRSKFSTWLFQVAKNRMLDDLRARERRPTGDHLPAESELRASDPPFERGETIDAIWRGVAALPVELKMSLLLRDISGFSYIEIAEILDTTRANVKWRIYQAREYVTRSVAAEGLLDAA